MFADDPCEAPHPVTTNTTPSSAPRAALSSIRTPFRGEPLK
jgi:hypothetical protein